ncbi:DUF2267 domain-containing protein [Streptomyces sp. Q6]|uniref:DUF2267 domain-containing protein n=1 Tax=Streptomyces citrinus TaxID=3118173 RepID=A0ACD5AEB3_9ACTN
MSRPAYGDFVEAARVDGLYPSRSRADATVRRVLAEFGRQVTGPERVALAGALPREAAVAFVSDVPHRQPRTGAEFVEDLAARSSGATAATARWDAGTVLTALARTVPDDVMDDVLARLPTGYALLFGRAELAPRAAA